MATLAGANALQWNRQSGQPSRRRARKNGELDSLSCLRIAIIRPVATLARTAMQPTIRSSGLRDMDGGLWSFSSVYPVELASSSYR